MLLSKTGTNALLLQTRAAAMSTMTGKDPTVPLIVYGLGNYTFPGTKHSLGQMVVDSLAKRTRASAFTFDKTLHAWTSQASVDVLEDGSKSNVVFVKSKYLMNMSGSTAQQLAKRYPSMLTSRRLLVVHDETELKPGQTATRFGGSLKGHNGLRDIAARLKDNRDWHRFRVGIGKPERGSSVTLAEWCLGPCFRDELEMCGQDGAVTQAAWQAVQEILLFQQK